MALSRNVRGRGNSGKNSTNRGVGGQRTELLPSDSELVERTRRGDEQAYAELYRRHVVPVRRYARSCCRDEHTAGDLTTEVFTRTLQELRRSAGPDTAVRAHLLSTVWRVAASWRGAAGQERLVDGFAAFASRMAQTQGRDTDCPDPGPEVRAVQEAERSLAVRAFRSLPERWQTVLWHMTVENESPRRVALHLGLPADAAGALARRAREGLRQAYLQAHVGASLAAGGECARFGERMGVYVRGGLRIRVERGLHRHLGVCARCRTTALEVRDVDARLRTLLPVAVVGWFASGYALGAARADGTARADGAGGAAGTGVAAATEVAAGTGVAGGTGVAAGTRGAAGTGVAAGTRTSSGTGEGAGAGAGAAPAPRAVRRVRSSGPGVAVRAGVATGVAALAAATVFVLTSGEDGSKQPQARTPASAQPAPPPSDDSDREPAPRPSKSERAYPEPPLGAVSPDRAAAIDRGAGGNAERTEPIPQTGASPGTGPMPPASSGVPADVRRPCGDVVVGLPVPFVELSAVTVTLDPGSSGSGWNGSEDAQPVLVCG